MKKFRLILTGLICAFVLGACSTPGSTQTENQTGGTSVEGKTEVEDKVLRLASDQEVDSLDPHLGNSNYTTIVTSGLYEGLVQFHNGEYLPGVAKSWETNEDSTVYTFYLRDNAKWSDGKTVTAEDFVNSLQLLVSRPEAVGYAYLAGNIKNANAIINGELDRSELGVKALDEFTLEITLEAPTSYFLSLASFPTFFPLREDAYNEFGEGYGSSVDKLVTNGPFVLTELENQSKYVMTKSENYWNKDNINLDGVEIYIIPDKGTQISMYEAGEIDVVNIPNEYVEEYEQKGEARFFDDGSIYFVQISAEGVTEESGALVNNEDFKFALSNAIDRDAFVNAVFKNGSKANNRQVLGSVVAYGGVTFGEEYSDVVSKHPLNKNEEAAKAYLAKAMDTLGYSDVSELPEVDFLIADREADRIVAEYIQDAVLQTLGVKLNIRTLTFSQKYDQMQTYKYDLGWAGWGPDYNDANTYLDMFTSHGYSAAYIGWTSEEYDAFMNQASLMPDGKERADVLFQAEQYVLEHGPVIPIYAGSASWTSKPNVTGYYKNFVGAENDYIFTDK